METATHSFASRRPAAGGLPQFQLPPPNPPLDAQIPRVTGSDGLSPLSSSINSGSSQSSQAGTTPYNSQGNWPLNSSYTYSSMNHGGQPGLMQPNYARAIYSPTTGAGYHARSSQSPATGEGLSTSPYDAVGHPFPLPMPGGGSNQSGMLSQPPHQNSILSTHTAASQPPTPSTTASSDNYSRGPPTPGYYTAPHSSTPQQTNFPSFASTHPSPTQASPTTTGSASRGIPALSTHQPSPIQAPPHYPSRVYGGYPTMHQTLGGGPVLTNMANPGGQMTLVGGMNSMHGYHPGHHMHHGMYPGQPNTPQDRPFKCDICPQSFNRNHDLKRHKRIHLAVKPFPCDACDKSFSRKDALKRHRLVKGCGARKSSPNGGNDGSPQEDMKMDEDMSPDSIHGFKEELE